MKCAYFNCFLLPNYLKFFQLIEAFFCNKKIEASFVVTKVQASHDKFPNPTNPDPLAQDKWNAILLCCSISDLIDNLLHVYCIVRQYSFVAGISANRSYKKRNQAIVLTGLLGDEEEGAGILASNYLARGHLTPDADFGAKSKLFLHLGGLIIASLSYSCAG